MSSHQSFLVLDHLSRSFIFSFNFWFFHSSQSASSALPPWFNTQRETKSKSLSMMESSQNDNDKSIEKGLSTDKPPISSVTTSGNSDDNEKEPSKCQCLIDFYWENEFVILIILVILLARAYPPLGAEYLAEEITASWIAVIFIFSE